MNRHRTRADALAYARTRTLTDKGGVVVVGGGSWEGSRTLQIIAGEQL